MILDWKGKIAARPWMRTFSDGFVQIYTRVLGTTVVIPPTQRHLGATWSINTSIGAPWSRGTSISGTWSE